MAKNLVIVESPAKASTIEKYLGKDYVVKSSFGHVRDLASKGLAIDVENDFQPNYEVSADKKKLVTELKKLSKEAEVVWLATDEDREGEAISWHLKEALKLKDDKTKRITFNEITENAITTAIKNPRDIDYNLVDAQQARRVLDRLVGFELSPVLWRKVKPSLSAGRVQSVTVRLVVEREREIESFKPETYYKVVGDFDVEGRSLKADYNTKIKSKEQAQEIFLALKNNDTYTVSNLETKPFKRKPSAPFTTSTLQQEASRKIGFSPSKTMMVAQRLYESGAITYMRTDSVHLSDFAMDGIKKEINDVFGSKYYKSRSFSVKSKGAQEAHEAIRPTNFAVSEIDSSENDERRLYQLIWKRTVSSQMADAELERSKVFIENTSVEKEFVAQAETVVFDGFLKLYIESTDDEDQKEDAVDVLPPLKIGQVLPFNEISGAQKFTNNPARYTEASLVKKLEELGIGRPSTYAPTVSTIQKRAYVEKSDRDAKVRKVERILLKPNASIENIQVDENFGAERKKLFPSDIGRVVTDFLIENFADILDYNFTAKVEKEFDDIASGLLKWNKMIDAFYGPFHKEVEDTINTAERASGERALGDDPKTGKPIIARIGRFGPMVQIGVQDDEEKPKFASLKKEQSINTITLEEALDLFKLPRDLGEYEDKKVTVAIGRFGPYVKFGSLFVSLKVKEGDDPMTIEFDRAVELIEEKKEIERNKLVKEFEEDETIKILNGRWGAYIKHGKKNVKIPKEKKENAKELTFKEVQKLIKESKK